MMWTENRVKAAMIKSSLLDLQKHLDEGSTSRGQMEFLLPKSRAKTYTPLLERLKCPSLEDRIEKNEAKRRKFTDDSSDVKQDE